MSKKIKSHRPKAARPRGFADTLGEAVRTQRRMREKVSAVFELYGFEPLVTPAFEFSDALGKFLPDEERPNEGVFSLTDDDERWLSLRYDLTAPLARFVAENYDGLTKPFRRYQEGLVWRNEKPGPGRYREFMQMDADTVGTASVAADAEMAMLAADCLEALGLARTDYVIKINNRKLMDAVLEKLDLAGTDEARAQRLVVMRAIDKLDRLGSAGVAALLGPGRMDTSGDYTKGAGLSDTQISTVMGFVGAGTGARDASLAAMAASVAGTQIGDQGLGEMAEIDSMLTAAGFDADRVVFDPSVVRGLGYYTGPVLEAELTFQAPGDDGAPGAFGSVGGGGRYDDLVARFRGQPVPATGFSIGLSRLAAALETLQKNAAQAPTGPVVVLVMDHDQRARSQSMARELRAAGIRAEMYLGTSGMRAQMKYADRRGAPAVIIEGEDERSRGEIMIKDLVEGTRLSTQIEGNAEWRESRPAQVAVARPALVASVREILARHGGDREDDRP